MFQVMPENKTLLFVFKYSPVRSIKLQARFVCMHTHTYVFRTVFNEDGCRRSMQIFSPTRFILITLIHIEIGDIRNNFKQRECQEAKFFLQGDPSLSLPRRFVFKLVREEQIFLLLINLLCTQCFLLCMLRQCQSIFFLSLFLSLPCSLQ